MKNFSYNNCNITDKKLTQKINTWLTRHEYKPNFNHGSEQETCSMIEHFSNRYETRLFWKMISRHFGGGRFNSYGWGCWGYSK